MMFRLAELAAWVFGTPDPSTTHPEKQQQKTA